MDLSKFKTSDWLKVGGGGLMLIAYFLKWWKVDTAFGDFGAKGSDYFFTGTIPWLLLVAIGVLTFLAAAGVFKLPASIPTPLVFLAASALSLLLLIVRFFSSGAGTNDGLSRGVGLFLALIAAILVVVGSFLGFQESGGDLNDLKDVNKLKSQFGGSGSSGSAPPPPPPPPGMPPPPPPA